MKKSLIVLLFLCCVLPPLFSSGEYHHYKIEMYDSTGSAFSIRSVDFISSENLQDGSLNLMPMQADVTYSDVFSQFLFDSDPNTKLYRGENLAPIICEFSFDTLTEWGNNKPIGLIVRPEYGSSAPKHFAFFGKEDEASDWTLIYETPDSWKNAPWSGVQERVAMFGAGITDPSDGYRFIKIFPEYVSPATESQLKELEFFEFSDKIQPIRAVNQFYQPDSEGDKLVDGNYSNYSKIIPTSNFDSYIFDFGEGIDLTSLKATINWSGAAATNIHVLAGDSIEDLSTIEVINCGKWINYETKRFPINSPAFTESSPSSPYRYLTLRVFDSEGPSYLTMKSLKFVKSMNFDGSFEYIDLSSAVTTDYDAMDLFDSSTSNYYQIDGSYLDGDYRDITIDLGEGNDSTVLGIEIESKFAYTAPTHFLVIGSVNNHSFEVLYENSIIQNNLELNWDSHESRLLPFFEIDSITTPPYQYLKLTIEEASSSNDTDIREVEFFQGNTQRYANRAINKYFAEDTNAALTIDQDTSSFPLYRINSDDAPIDLIYDFGHIRINPSDVLITCQYPSTSPGNVSLWVSNNNRDFIYLKSYNSFNFDSNLDQENINLIDPNAVLTAVDDYREGLPGVPIQLNVLENDTYGANGVMEVVGLTQPSNGIVQDLGRGVFLYSSTDPEFSGIENFTYTLSDGDGSLSTASVQFNVFDPNLQKLLVIDDPENFSTTFNSELNVNGQIEAGEVLEVMYNNAPISPVVEYDVNQFKFDSEMDFDLGSLVNMEMVGSGVNAYLIISDNNTYSYSIQDKDMTVRGAPLFLDSSENTYLLQLDSSFYFFGNEYSSVNINKDCFISFLDENGNGGMGDINSISPLNQNIDYSSDNTHGMYVYQNEGKIEFYWQGVYNSNVQIVSCQLFKDGSVDFLYDPPLNISDDLKIGLFGGDQLESQIVSFENNISGISFLRNLNSNLGTFTSEVQSSNTLKLYGAYVNEYDEYENIKIEYRTSADNSIWSNWSDEYFVAVDENQEFIQFKVIIENSLECSQNHIDSIFVESMENLDPINFSINNLYLEEPENQFIFSLKDSPEIYRFLNISSITLGDGVSANNGLVPGSDNLITGFWTSDNLTSQSEFFISSGNSNLLSTSGNMFTINGLESLGEGAHSYEMTLVNDDGESVSLSGVILIDHTTPRLNVTPPQNNTESGFFNEFPIEYDLDIYDLSGIDLGESEILLNGKSIPFSESKVIINSAEQGLNTLSFRIVDNANNQVSLNSTFLFDDISPGVDLIEVIGYQNRGIIRIVPLEETSGIEGVESVDQAFSSVIEFDGSITVTSSVLSVLNNKQFKLKDKAGNSSLFNFGDIVPEYQELEAYLYGKLVTSEMFHDPFEGFVDSSANCHESLNHAFYNKKTVSISWNYDDNDFIDNGNISFSYTKEGGFTNYTYNTSYSFPGYSETCSVSGDKILCEWSDDYGYDGTPISGNSLIDFYDVNPANYLGAPTSITNTKKVYDGGFVELLDEVKASDISVPTLPSTAGDELLSNSTFLEGTVRADLKYYDDASATAQAGIFKLGIEGTKPVKLAIVDFSYYSCSDTHVYETPSISEIALEVGSRHITSDYSIHTPGFLGAKFKKYFVYHEFYAQSQFMSYSMDDLVNNQPSYKPVSSIKASQTALVGGAGESYKLQSTEITPIFDFGYAPDGWQIDSSTGVITAVSSGNANPGHAMVYMYGTGKQYPIGAAVVKLDVVEVEFLFCSTCQLELPKYMLLDGVEHFLKATIKPASLFAGKSGEWVVSNGAKVRNWNIYNDHNIDLTNIPSNFSETLSQTVAQDGELRIGFLPITPGDVSVTFAVDGLQVVNEISTIVDFDIDVNNDKIGDIDIFTPGYNGDVPVISFNPVNNGFSLQKIDILAIGLNGKSGFTLELDSTVATSYDGYASNTPAVQAVFDLYDFELININEDISQSHNEISFDMNGVANAYLNCLDYGGKAKLILKEKGKDLFSITLPIDKDNDGIADIWEKKYVDVPSDLSRTADDDEFNHNLNSFSGDKIKVFDEYRGFAISGINHVRTDPEKIEYFCSIDSGIVGFESSIAEKLGYQPYLIESWQFRRNENLEENQANYSSVFDETEPRSINAHIKLDNSMTHLGVTGYDEEDETHDIIRINNTAIESDGWAFNNFTGTSDDPNFSYIFSPSASQILMQKQNVLMHELGHYVYLKHQNETRGHHTFVHDDDVFSGNKRCIMKYLNFLGKTFGPLTIEMTHCGECMEQTQPR